MTHRRSCTLALVPSPATRNWLLEFRRRALLVDLSGRSRAGPILFKQRRIGACGEPFDLLRFRTMGHLGAVRLPPWAQRASRGCQSLQEKLTCSTLSASDRTRAPGCAEGVGAATTEALAIVVVPTSSCDDALTANSSGRHEGSKL